MPEESVRHLYSMFKHPVFLSTFFAWLIAQLIKSVIELFKRRSRTNKPLLTTLLWSTGGMPSSHSSMTVALATSLGFTEGLNSPLFIAMIFYAALTIRDALGVRRSAGAVAKTLNNLGAVLTEKLEIQYVPVKEIHGHNMTEVSVGILLGFFIAVAFCNL